MAELKCVELATTAIQRSFRLALSALMHLRTVLGLRRSYKPGANVESIEGLIESLRVSGAD
jgi:hypothetical protein